jgi:hypothetical protein
VSAERPEYTYDIANRKLFLSMFPVVSLQCSYPKSFVSYAVLVITTPFPALNLLSIEQRM